MNNKNRIKTWLAVTTLSSVFATQALADCANEFQRLKPTHQYTENFDGTVTDQETGVTWRKCPLGSTWDAGADTASAADDSCAGTPARLNWKDALTAADAVAGFHMANVKELTSIFDLACKNPAVNTQAFPLTGVPGNIVWSSTPVASNDRKVWAFSFHKGEDVQKPKNAEFVVFLAQD